MILPKFKLISSNGESLMKKHKPARISFFNVNDNFIGKSIFINAWLSDNARVDKNQMQKNDSPQV